MLQIAGPHPMGCCGDGQERLGTEEHGPTFDVHQGSFDDMVGWPGSPINVLDRRDAASDEGDWEHDPIINDQEPDGPQQHASDDQSEGSSLGISYHEWLDEDGQTLHVKCKTAWGWRHYVFTLSHWNDTYV